MNRRPDLKILVRSGFESEWTDFAQYFISCLKKFPLVFSSTLFFMLLIKIIISQKIHINSLYATKILQLCNYEIYNQINIFKNIKNRVPGPDRIGTRNPVFPWTEDWTGIVRPGPVPV